MKQSTEGHRSSASQESTGKGLQALLRREVCLRVLLRHFVRRDAQTEVRKTRAALVVVRLAILEAFPNAAQRSSAMDWPCSSAMRNLTHHAPAAASFALGLSPDASPLCDCESCRPVPRGRGARPAWCS